MNSRRELLFALGASGLAAPFISFAQPQGKVWRIGFLGVGFPAEWISRVDSLRAGLRDLGYVEGKNFQFEFELTEPTKSAVATWLERAHLGGSISVPQPVCEFAACLDTAICADRASVGRSRRAGFIGLWNAFDAAHQGDSALQADEEPEGCSIIAWPFQAGKHRPIPWQRGR